MISSSVCDDGWTIESEAVACREMGYSALKMGGMSQKKGGCKDAQGVNLCGQINQKINVINMVSLDYEELTIIFIL